MSTVLLRPDLARGKPSSLLKDEDAYRDIFNLGYPLKMYLNAVRIHHIVDMFARAKLYTKDRNNIKFHLMMYAIIRIKDERTLQRKI